MGPRALARVCCLVIAALATSPACAFRRLVERDDFLVRPAFALVAGVGTYNPAGNTGSSQLRLTTALRYLRPDADDATWHSLGFEVGVSTWSSSTADILTTYGEVMYFWPRTPAFTFDHHFFAGLSLGSARVDRSAPLTSLTETVGQIEGGLQGRVRDWFLELRLKYDFGPTNTVYDITGFAPSFSAAYHFQL